MQAYLAAMPGWKRDVGRRLDALIARTVPGVQKAVKWKAQLMDTGGGANNPCVQTAVVVPVKP